MLRQIVECLEFAGEVLFEVPGMGLLAGETLYKRFGQVDASERVHMLTQPIMDKGGIALGQLLIKIGEDRAKFVQDLRTVQVAQRIRWEVTKAECPVYILHHTIGIIGRSNAQVLLV